ncbi:MAG: DUF3143 domain-containing protein [Cyanobacteriota bacterium]|nr:DUF3143 domain-containing protein [Cyanobacteriota bacterium]
MVFPSASTPLYNHPLPTIEKWLIDQGCSRDPDDVEQWFCRRPTWQAEIRLEETSITARYTFSDGQSKTLSFPYSLSRADIEQAIFAE